MTSSLTRRWGRTGTRFVLVVALTQLLLAVTWTLAPAVQAHASLVSTDPPEGAVLPQAPETLTLTFDEPVDLSPEATRLYDAQGAEVTSEARSVDEVVTVTPEAELADGTFVLTYRVISTDGHPVAGSLTFSVGAPSDTVIPPDAAVAGSDPAVTAVHGVVQGVSYLALLLAAGLALFMVLLLPDSAALDQTRGRLLRVMRIAASVAVLGFLLLVPVGAVYQQGTGLGGLSSLAAWHLESIDAMLFLLVLFGLGVASGTLTVDAPDRRDRYVIPAVIGTALAGLALVGHTRAYGPPFLVVASDVVHVYAAAVWFGGLVGLALTLPTMAKREQLAARTLARFSTLAGGLLVAVAVAGVVLGWRILGSWTALVTTPYGLILLTKTALVALVVAVAGWNRYRLLPHVLTATGHQPRVCAADRLRRAVQLEAVGLAVVILLTGFLVNQVPRDISAAPSAQGRGVLAATADEVQVVAHLAPRAVGSNTLVVQVQTTEGEPLEPLATPSVSVAVGEVDLGRVTVRNTDSGTYEGRVVIPRPGTVTIQVGVRLDQFTNPVLTLTTEVE